jgi:hypothetical protein
MLWNGLEAEASSGGLLQSLVGVLEYPHYPQAEQKPEPLAGPFRILRNSESYEA